MINNLFNELKFLDKEDFSVELFIEDEDLVVYYGDTIMDLIRAVDKIMKQFGVFNFFSCYHFSSFISSHFILIKF